MKVKTAELSGAALDWAVAKAEGLLEPMTVFPFGSIVKVSGQRVTLRYNRTEDDEFTPTTDWSQGGPIIEREGISTTKCNPLYFPNGNENGDYWEEYTRADSKSGTHCYGPTPLIAAMRCFVASKLGDEVDIPDELLKE